jgi:hypothetical protein
MKLIIDDKFLNIFIWLNYIYDSLIDTKASINCLFSSAVLLLETRCDIKAALYDYELQFLFESIDHNVC